MDAPDAASALSWCLPGRFSLEDGTCLHQLMLSIVKF